jgi:hypothetical protein
LGKIVVGVIITSNIRYSTAVIHATTLIDVLIRVLNTMPSSLKNAVY